jgi:hypothetical protein
MDSEDSDIKLGCKIRTIAKSAAEKQKELDKIKKAEEEVAIRIKIDRLILKWREKLDNIVRLWCKSKKFWHDSSIRVDEHVDSFIHILREYCFDNEIKYRDVRMMDNYIMFRLYVDEDFKKIINVLRTI